MLTASSTSLAGRPENGSSRRRAHHGPVEKMIEERDKADEHAVRVLAFRSVEGQRPPSVIATNRLDQMPQLLEAWRYGAFFSRSMPLKRTVTTCWYQSSETSEDLGIQLPVSVLWVPVGHSAICKLSSANTSGVVKLRMSSRLPASGGGLEANEIQFCLPLESCGVKIGGDCGLFPMWLSDRSGAVGLRTARVLHCCRRYARGTGRWAARTAQ